MKSHQIQHQRIMTDDLAFSAYLKMKGYPLIKLDHQNKKSSFTFEIGDEDASALKMEFINSAFLNYYNELRNLKKFI